jgi:hypothetical protein
MTIQFVGQAWRSLLDERVRASRALNPHTEVPLPTESKYPTTSVVKRIARVFIESISCCALVLNSPFSKGGFRGICPLSNPLLLASKATN